MKTRRPLLYWLCCFLLITSLSAQQSIITGTLLDEQTGEPVPFATIGIKGQNIGVISNLEGDFQIPLTYQKQGDTIVISCIGYITLEMALSQLSMQQANTITIQRAAYVLPEAVVRFKQRKQLSAGQIVYRAIRRIPDNFPQSPFSYIGYYRDYQKRHGQYINLNEAIVEVFDRGFQTDNRFVTQMKLYNYLLNEDFVVNDSFAIAYDNKNEKFVPNAEMTPFGGNELSILMMHDAVRNHRVHSYSFVNIFDTDFYHQHKFSMSEPTVVGDIILHSITFEGRRPYLGPKFDVEGRIYIESGNFAIHKLEYRVYDKEEDTRRLLYDIQVEYARGSDGMYLNYISFNNLFYLSKPPLFRVDGIRLDTTQSNTGAVGWNLRTTYLEVIMNKSPDRSSALNKDNYSIKLAKRKVQIERIIPDGAYAVRLFLNNEDVIPLLKDIDQWLPQLKIEFGEIYDRHHHLLNEPQYEEARQYRELFRQKITTTTTADRRKDLPFIDRDTTLSANFQLLQPVTGTMGYWMNTPLKQ
ncbi:MAG: carboxypeptidase-like regulatory domain-containing protein [Saprospiraceae bacterium]|nr:carboxypeptidase-like regulatory domain-containing protein [Lewinella sp.]